MKKLLTLLLIVCLLFSFGCSSQQTNDSGLIKDGVFTIAMECSYSPYNWAQADDSNGAVKIKDSNDYVNGYDIMIAKMICAEYGWQLEVVRSDWDSLVPAVQSRRIDAAIAGQSMTAERSLAVDFAGPYYYASFAILVKKDSNLVNATSINDFSGMKGTAQMSTIWYTDCLPQMSGVEILTPSESASAMLMALETNKCDFVVTDLPTATRALKVYDDFYLLDFTNTAGDFQFSQQEREENVNIGISVCKGNTALLTAINNVLNKMTVEDFNELMEKAILIAPTGE